MQGKHNTEGTPSGKVLCMAGWLDDRPEADSHTADNYLQWKDVV